MKFKHTFWFHCLALYTILCSLDFVAYSLSGLHLFDTHDAPIVMRLVLMAMGWGAWVFWHAFVTKDRIEDSLKSYQERWRTTEDSNRQLEKQVQDLKYKYEMTEEEKKKYDTNNKNYILGYGNLSGAGGMSGPYQQSMWPGLSGYFGNPYTQQNLRPGEWRVAG